MEDRFYKFFVYAVVIVSLLNLISGLFHKLCPSTVTRILLAIASLPELFILITALIISLYVVLKRYEKFYLILPMTYFIVFVAVMIFSIIDGRISDPLDTSTTANLLLVLLQVALYIVAVALGTYTIRKRPLKAKKEKKKAEAIGIVSVVLGAISFIPLIGFFLGIAAIITGIIDYKKNKGILGVMGIILGILGMLFTIGIYGSLFYFVFMKRGGIYDDMRTDMSKKNLQDIVNYLESYNLRYGEYPRNITSLSRITDTSNLIDPLQVNLNNTDIYYYYQKEGAKYRLFSRGIDGIPYTFDDIYPEFERNPGEIGLIMRDVWGTEFYLFEGDSIEYDGNKIKLDKVYDDSIILTINEEETEIERETVNFLTACQIRLEEVFFIPDATDNSATIDIIKCE